MKNMKKIIAVLMSLSAITMTTSAFAATTGTGTATYTEGAVKLVTEQLPSDANTQLTVVIVPANLGADAITSQNIYYINQGAAGTEFAEIIKAMKVKDGADFATNTYEVRIGGALANDYYVYTITGAQLEEVIEYGNVDGDYADDGVTPVISVNDAVYVLKYVVDNTVEFPNKKGQAAAIKAANVDGDYADDGVTPVISVNDAVYILKHVVDSSVEFPAAKAE